MGATRYSGTLCPCHCEGVRSTLKTLSYDCGNPGQYVCGRSPAVLFYLLDRHALLAMTRGSKGVFLNSLTTPTLRVTPPMEGNLVRTVAGQSSPLRRGGRIPGPARPVAWVVSPGWSLYPTPRRTKCDTPRPGTTHANYVCAGPGGGGHFRPRRFVFYSMAQGCSNSYVPVASVYDTPTGAYIMHDPPGLDARQLVAVPADV